MLTVKTYLEKSPVNGLGCFADEFIPKGAIIWRMQHNFDVILTDEQYNALPQIAKEWVNHYGYYNQKEGGHVLCMDNAKYLNHSDLPNTDDTGEFITTAKMDINKGEEILSDYFSFDEKSAKTKTL